MNQQTSAAPTPGFVHETRVAWGDCDPANIVFSARIPGFALDAIDAWWEQHMEGDSGWYHLERDLNIGTPFVHMSMDFSAPITPRHRLRCEVWPFKLGTSSIGFRVKGRQDGVLCFAGEFTCVFVVADAFKVQPAPKDIRQMVEPLLRD